MIPRPGTRGCLARILGGLFLSLVLGGQVSGDEIRVAVAANYTDCLKDIATAFTDSTGHRLIISPGSTGRHYAQIKSGAPFDLFLAADVHRPALLEEDGLIVPGSRFTYAEGRLALWLPAEGPGDKRDVPDILAAAAFQHLAIANPRLAPYGLAAQQTLEYLGLWDDLKDRLVIGQSVGQAWQFVASGNAEAGLVAYPQILAAGEARGQWWKIDPPLHEPILQQAVALAAAENLQAALVFLDFLKGPQARLIMIRCGYLIPEN